MLQRNNMLQMGSCLESKINETGSDYFLFWDINESCSVILS
jgi:hypothetical protein